MSNQLKVNTLDNECKNYHLSWNTVLTTKLTVQGKTIQNTATMGCKWNALMDGGWITVIKQINQNDV